MPFFRAGDGRSTSMRTLRVAIGRTHRGRKWPMSHRGHSRRGGKATATNPGDETATTPTLQAHRRRLHEPVPGTHPQGSRQPQSTLCTRRRHRWHRLVRVPLGTSADRAFALHVVRRRVCIRRSFGEARCVIACVHGRVPQEGSFQIRRAWSASGHSFRKKGTWCRTSLISSNTRTQELAAASSPANLLWRDQRPPAQYAPDSTGRNTG